METLTRACADCGSPLPDTATARRRYCTDACRDRAKKRRRRSAAGSTARSGSVPALAAARRRISDLETQLARARSRIQDRDGQLAELRSAGRRRERAVIAHADRALRSRVHRIVDTRDRLATVSADLEAAMSGNVDRTDLDVAARRIVDLQRRVTELGDRYDRLAGDHQALRDRYERLVSEANAAADRLADLGRDRSRLRLILGQWDTLAGRLALSAQGRSLSAGDRTIVATWAQWKTTVSEAEKTDRTPTTRQSARVYGPKRGVRR